MSGTVCMLNKTGAGKIRIQSSMIFFCANVYFKAKPSEVVGKDGGPYFGVGTGLKKMCHNIHIAFRIDQI